MAKKVKRGRGRPRSTGAWLSVRQICFKIDVRRDTVDRYLSHPDAPKKNKKGEYELEAVRAFIQKQGVKLNGADIQELKNDKLRLEIEAKTFEFEKEKGEWVKKSEIEGSIIPLVAQASEALRQKFERELPSQYRGKNQSECQQLNQEALDAIFDELRAGALTVGNPA